MFVIKGACIVLVDDFPRRCPDNFVPASVTLTAIVTALLATGVYALVQVIICKYHPKFKHNKTSNLTITREREDTSRSEGHQYEGLSRRERGVTTNDPAYAEIAGRFEVQPNQAYQTTAITVSRNQAYSATH